MTHRRSAESALINIYDVNPSNAKKALYPLETGVHNTFKHYHRRNPSARVRRYNKEVAGLLTHSCKHAFSILNESMAFRAYDNGTHSSGTVQDFHLFPFSLQQGANHFYERKGKKNIGIEGAWGQKNGVYHDA